MARKGDPYLNDPNIRKAANMQMFTWPALLAAIGAAAAGWFEFDPLIGIAGGLVAGFVIASTILSHYGGRSTR
jgi:4-hydroxybenzoate polyprenyltransferase